MKNTTLQILCLSLLIPFAARAADTNPPPRLTVELRDGSRVVGESVGKYFKFHSDLLGEIKLDAKNIRSVEWASTNSAKLATTGGDNLTVSFEDSSFAVNTSFGKVDLAADSIRKFTVSDGGKPGTHPAGLVALWSGEGDGKDSVGGNDAIPIGNVAYADGKVGRAFSLDGSTSYLRVPASPSLNVGAGDGLTITAWIKPNAFDVEVSGAPIVEWDSDTTDGLEFWSGSALFANIKGISGDNHTMNFSCVLDTKNFQFVALTYDKSSGAAAIFLNGEMVASQNFGSFTPQTTYPVNIGRRTGQPVGNGDNYGGLIDELAIYGRALSTAEIQAIYSDQK